MVPVYELLNFKDTRLWLQLVTVWLDRRNMSLSDPQVAQNIYLAELVTLPRLEKRCGVNRYDIVRHILHSAEHDLKEKFMVKGSYREWSNGVVEKTQVTTEHGTAYLLGGDLDSFLSIYFPSVHFHLKEFDPEKHSLIVEPDYNLMV